jgi:hypothetical protein
LSACWNGLRCRGHDCSQCCGTKQIAFRNHINIPSVFTAWAQARI